MAISLTGVSLPVRAPVIRAEARSHGRRISPEAGHALETLGHAIDYLIDEYINEGGLFGAHDPRVEAIQLLMALNRQVYLACPEAPTLGDRFRSWLSPN